MGNVPTSIFPDRITEIRQTFKHLLVKDDWYKAEADLVEWIEKNEDPVGDVPMDWEKIKEKYGGTPLTQTGKQCLAYLEMAEALDRLDFKETGKLLTIEEAASALGISPSTLRNWEEQGKIAPSRTEKGHRRYTRAQIQEIRKQQMKDQEFLLPNVTPNDVLDMVQKLLSTFDPMERINVTIRQDCMLKKVRLTVDSADGLCTVTKSFDMKE